MPLHARRSTQETSKPTGLQPGDGKPHPAPVHESVAPSTLRSARPANAASWRDVLLCLLVLVLVAGVLHTAITGADLSYPDEFKTAQRSREFLTTGDWLTVHFNHTPSHNKPPLQYWITAGALAGGIPTTPAVRLPSALATLACLLLLAPAARRVLGNASSTLILCASFGPFLLWGGTGVLDAGQTLACLAVLLLWQPVGDRRPGVWAAAVIAGLAAWQKTPLALCFLYLLVLLPRQTLRSHWKPLALATLIAAAWPALQGIRHGPAYLEALRVAEFGTWADRPRNLGPLTYPLDLLKLWLGAGVLAWLALFRTLASPFFGDERPALIRDASRLSLVFLAIAGFVPGHSTRYLLPIVPLLALCAAWEITRTPTERFARFHKLGTGILLATTVAAGVLNLASARNPGGILPADKALLLEFGRQAQATPESVLVRLVTDDRSSETPLALILFESGVRRTVQELDAEACNRLIREGQPVLLVSESLPGSVAWPAGLEALGTGSRLALGRAPAP